MRLGSDLLEELAHVGRTNDDAIDMGEAALVLAAIAKPNTPREPYRRHLQKVFHEVAAYVDGYRGVVPLKLRHEALVQVIYKRFGYVGTKDCFDDIEAASLMRVIDRRGGLPVALGILYLEAARHIGWSAVGIDFPGRFLVRLDAEGPPCGGRLIIDPCDGGSELNAPDLRRILKLMTGPEVEIGPMHYRAVGSRAVLLRLQNNIKTRHLDAGRVGAALSALETMAALAPDDAALWREIGVLHTRLGQTPAAVAALEECLRHEGPEQLRYSASALLQELCGRPG